MYHCEVLGCTSHSAMPGITMYLFPSESANLERHLLWKQKAGITKPITNEVRICNMHFNKNDFYQRKKNTTSNQIVMPLLKPTAVPNRNLPGQCYEEDVSDEEPSTEELLRKRKIENENEIHFDITKTIDPISNLVECTDSADASTKQFMQKHFGDYWSAKGQAKLCCIELDDNKKKYRPYDVVIPPHPPSMQQTEFVTLPKIQLEPPNLQYVEPINVMVTEVENQLGEAPICKIGKTPPEYIVEIGNKLSDMKELINSRMDKLESEIAELRNINLLAQQFPFDNPTDLLDFESKIKNTPDLMQSFRHYLNSIPGAETGELYLTKILDKLFTSDLRKNVVWDTSAGKINGRINRPTSKIIINNFKLISLIRSAVLQQFNANVNYNGVQEEFKRFFCH